MKKLLLLIPQNIIPAVDGGKAGIYFPMQLLAKEYEVKAVVFVSIAEDTNKLAYHSLGVEVFFLRVNKIDSPIQLIKNAFQQLPLKFNKYYKKTHQSFIDELCMDWQPASILCHHAHLAYYLRNYKSSFPNIRLLLREHNIEYLIVEQFYRTEKKMLHKAIGYWQYLKTKKVEQHAWAWFHHVLFISDSDYSNVKETTGFEKHVLYDGGKQREIGNVKKADAFLFTGSVSSFQNAYNLSYFIHQVWIPWKEANSNQFELWVTGNDEKQVNDKLHLEQGLLEKYHIKLLGFVHDLDAVLQQAKYFVSPTIIGAGIRIKVIEALCNGCVVFLSPLDESMVACLEDGVNVLSFSDQTSFNNNFNKVNFSDNFYASISNNALQISREQLSWDILLHKIMGIINA